MNYLVGDTYKYLQIYKKMKYFSTFIYTGKSNPEYLIYIQESGFLSYVRGRKMILWILIMSFECHLILILLIMLGN